MWGRDYYERIGRHVEAEIAARGVYSDASPSYPWIPLNMGDCPFETTKREVSKRIVVAGLNIGDAVSYVCWAEGFISIFDYREDTYAVSYRFEGCFMAKFTIGGRCYIAHIHSSSPDPQKDTGAIWDALADEVNVLALFRPTDANDEMFTNYRAYDNLPKQPSGKYPRSTIAGVITPDNRCHSVLVDLDSNRAIGIYPAREIPRPFKILPVRF